MEREDLALGVLQPYDERVYGNTMLWFFEYPAPEVPDIPVSTAE
jgi:hypothetical protein